MVTPQKDRPVGENLRLETLTSRLRVLEDMSTVLVPGNFKFVPSSLSSMLARLPNSVIFRPDPAGELDCGWVLRWLDDVGLPQYKETFLEARVDGRLLNLLTIDDLSYLKVTNLLHHFSIRRGIEVLRQNNFTADCLKRRASPEEGGEDVLLWTNHRVMEWLREVDLAEYAPNLRGSGVHGGLLILEPKFNGQLLASLLSIPSSKTLLRRHLTIHFGDLIGRDIVGEKRRAESDPSYQPLTPSARVKSKHSQFTLKRKKSKAEFDAEDSLVCPLSPMPMHK